MATNYSFVVTWIHFSVYVLIFLVASWICATKVNDDYKNYKTIQQKSEDHDRKNWNKIGLLKQWGKLLWKKKKIYFQLIPHFFDQATDLGCILEYWSLRNDSIGINTLYLFWCSIFVIILHRIISSFAIYQLTKKKLFIIYQMFDVLMVRCIWTNYQLHTDEPSNSQRYLQVLEAIFESSPQILISTAFLIKSRTDEVSPIVIVSLITSFWSLSSRVAADDKQVCQQDWKSIEFQYRQCPIINFKYIVRLLWRFLEISSRIILLCLVWINMGGISVFIILAAEFLYLSFICFGLGIVDMMGNIMYLMAANSNKKSEQWAITMTRIFWAYRVISSYILLIIVSIFATTRFEAPQIEEYSVRYQQTIKDQVGFALFIYCWIATPIWQWLGAVIAFDFENLASVGRDVDQLIEDKKWGDVLELIKFGADFRAENTLNAIYNQGTELQKYEVIDYISEICLHQMIQKGILKDVFFRACASGQQSMMQYILGNSDVKVDDIDDNGRTALFYSSNNNDNRTVNMLINQYKCNCNIRDNDGKTVIDYLSENVSKKQQSQQATDNVDSRCSAVFKTLINDGNFEQSYLISMEAREQPTEVKEYIQRKLNGETMESSTQPKILINVPVKYDENCCANCNKQLLWFSTCNQCKKIFYCSNECQMEHLSVHQSECTKYNVICCGDTQCNKLFGKDDDFLTCPQCKNSYYCNDHCRQIGWSTHQYGCKKVEQNAIRCNYFICEKGLVKNNSIRCGKCENVFYCDNECLRKDRKHHGNDCKEMKNLRNKHRKGANWTTKEDNERPILNCGIAVLISLFITAIYVSKDIVGLVINSNNNCNTSINGETQHVSFDVDVWIMTGCISHIIIASFLCGSVVYWKWIDEYDLEEYPCCIFGCGCSIWIFLFSWMVIGFLFYSEMHDKLCANIVLSWSILTLLEIILAIFVAAGFGCVSFMEALIAEDD